MYQEVIGFWFKEIDSKKWWVKDPKFDQMVVERFSDIHNQAIQGELFEWRGSAEGRLAEVIVLDQFSRNMFRDRPQSFAYDPLALVLAQECLAGGYDQELSSDKRSFLLMPFMHSESKKIHETAIKLFEKGEGKSFLEYELKHKTIIDRFGRYPHRNRILGRESTQEELEFLKQPGSSF